ncbi:MAG: hydrogenase maturation nickel metallochaperone HypA [Desulfovibrionaceae bacterium]
MHEMSIVASILGIVTEELEKNQAQKLLVVRVCHGALSNLVPEALQFAFEAQTLDTPFAGARLELEEIPVILKCCACQTAFTPENGEVLVAPCPQCGQPLGHSVVQGNELFVQHIDAE